MGLHFAFIVVDHSGFSLDVIAGVRRLCAANPLVKSWAALGKTARAFH
jgi:hypothetical protein